MHRFALQDEVLALADTAGIPIAATILGKSVISERIPDTWDSTKGDSVTQESPSSLNRAI